MSKVDILTKLTMAQVASCQCSTKTPAVEHHAETCRYRVLREAKQEIAWLRQQLVEAGGAK